MFGGVSAEHEVSVVTGLQALEKVDLEKYEPATVYVSKTGEMFLIQSLRTRKEFLSATRTSVSFGKDAQGGYIKCGGLFGKKIYPYAAFLAFHGGTGESGPVQGLLESVGIPFTSSGVEGSVVAMNKRLTKEVLRQNDIPVLPDARFFADDIRSHADIAAARAIAVVGLPTIVKPVHLGSSIGIKVAKTDVELQKALLEAAFSDNEIIVEPFLSGITEFNCAVRKIDDTIETSEIERPLGSDAILSFADKYERGGKKTGAGMASLTRELPANIPNALKEKIEDLARNAYVAARLKGMARIDFMLSSDGELYLTEINPIPGSMAFYLWEATGIPYRTQISELLEQAVVDAKKSAEAKLEYKSDIVERFVGS